MRLPSYDFLCSKKWQSFYPLRFYVLQIEKCNVVATAHYVAVQCYLICIHIEIKVECSSDGNECDSPKV